jgi:methylated-DNA-protein-cysteine methyltransferase-like protein
MSQNFFQNVYQVVKTIPRGKVANYGKVAELAGNKRMARHVGWALHVNPSQEEIPCHRVVMKDGSCTPGFAFGGKGAQEAMLIAEGVEFVDGKVDMEKHGI